MLGFISQHRGNLRDLNCNILQHLGQTEYIRGHATGTACHGSYTARGKPITGKWPNTHCPTPFGEIFKKAHTHTNKKRKRKEEVENQCVLHKVV